MAQIKLRGSSGATTIVQRCILVLSGYAIGTLTSHVFFPNVDDFSFDNVEQDSNNIAVSAVAICAQNPFFPVWTYRKMALLRSKIFPNVCTILFSWTLGIGRLQNFAG